MKTVLWLTCAVSAGIYITPLLTDPDLWWHVTIGRWILSHLEFPVTDHWTMFGEGMTFRAYSWSFEILVALLERCCGVKGLMVGQIALAGVMGAAMSYVFSRISRDYFFGLLLGSVSIIGMFNHYTFRPQSVVWVIFSVLLLVAHRIRVEGLTRWHGVQLVVLMSLWANLHITTVFGLFALALWIWGPGRTVLTAKVLGLGFLGTLITPYLGGEWLTFLEKSGHPLSHAAITEFGPATILQYSTAFPLLLSALLLAFFHRTPNRFEYPKLLLVAVLTFGGLAFLKFMPFSVIALSALLAEYWGARAQEDAGNLGEAIERLRALVSKIPREGLAFLILCMVTVRAVNRYQIPLHGFQTPSAAVDFIVEQKLPRPLLNGFGDGGYLMYRFSSAEGELVDKVVIDGRTNIIPPHVWESYMTALKGGDRWRSYLDLVQPRTVLWRSDSPLIAILSATGEWTEVFRRASDTMGYVVLVRRDSVPAGVVVHESGA